MKSSPNMVCVQCISLALTPVASRVSRMSFAYIPIWTFSVKIKLTTMESLSSDKKKIKGIFFQRL